MLRFIIVLTAASTIIGLMDWSAQVRGATMAATVTSDFASAMKARVGNPDRTDIERPADADGWLFELLMDRLTVPLGPADQYIWPLGIRSHERWIMTIDRDWDNEAPVSDPSAGR